MAEKAIMVGSFIEKILLGICVELSTKEFQLFSFSYG